METKSSHLEKHKLLEYLDGSKIFTIILKEAQRPGFKIIS